MRLAYLVVSTAAALVAGTGGAFAQVQDRAGAFEQPFGLGYGAAEDPIETSTRDANGNRLVLNGRIMADATTSLSGGLMDGDGFSGSAMAVGNQLNVVTNGSWNTVIIDSTQINSGDVTASVGGDQ